MGQTVQMRALERMAQFPQVHSSREQPEVLLVPDGRNMHFSGPSVIADLHVTPYVAPVDDRASLGRETVVPILMLVKEAQPHPACIYNPVPTTRGRAKVRARHIVQTKGLPSIMLTQESGLRRTC